MAEEPAEPFTHRTWDSKRQSATVRMPPDLHGALLSAAGASGRSLNNEIVFRLKASLAAAAGGADEPKRLRTAEPRARYEAQQLGEPQQLLLSYFNALPPERQAALLTLLSQDPAGRLR